MNHPSPLHTSGTNVPGAAVASDPARTLARRRRFARGAARALACALALSGGVVGTGVLGGCRSTPRAEPGDNQREQLDRLAAWMVGSFSSREQARRDREFREIHLHMARIWPERTDGVWLYVEQAAAETPMQPYRQRVYQLSTRPDGKIVSAVYEFRGDPLRYAGRWKSPTPLSGMGPADLVPRPGCEVVLAAAGAERFEGGTEGEGCVSTLRGASYARSRVVITARGLDTWDQGFNAAGEQVWGSVKGAYEFRRDPSVGR